ncbi:hypothetical protein, partial [Bartonella sp. CL25QHWL]|uniref:hypothetical protein n=1 Tax=Bartonella sp. CL25QHWL TaxID=3243518 RepID=UPI0035D0C9C5
QEVESWRKDTTREVILSIEAGSLSLFLCSFICLTLCTCPQWLTGYSALVVGNRQTVLLINSL